MAAAVLALVIERPSYGYELSRRFEERFSDLYPVSRARIYQVLNQLLDHGLIEHMHVEAELLHPRQPKPHYRATATGARLHREWLAATIASDPRREELLRRLLATAAKDVRTMLRIVDVYERACLDDMARKTLAPAPATELRDLLLSEEQRLVHEARLRFITFARQHIAAEMEGDDAPAN